MLRRSFLGLLALLPWASKANAEPTKMGDNGTPCPVCGRALAKYSSYRYGGTIVKMDDDGVVRETPCKNVCNCADAPHNPSSYGMLVDAGDKCTITNCTVSWLDRNGVMQTKPIPDHTF